MSMNKTSAEQPTRLRTTPRSRRIGYAVAIVVNLVMIALTLVWPGWRAVPFLTPAAEDVVPLFVASLVAGVAVNVVNLVADSRALRAIGDVVTGVIAFFVAVRVWQVFPFDFSAYAFDWAPFVRLLLLITMAAVLIAILTNFVILVRLAVNPPPPRTR